jgi:hypothetical protein
VRRAAGTLATSLLVAACLAGPAAAAGTAPILAMVGNGTTESVAWLDPASLRPAAGRASVYVGLHDIPHAFSPDGSLLAMGSGRTDSLVVVDLRRMQTVGRLELSFPLAVGWISDRRLVIVESRLERQGGRALTATVVAVRRSGLRAEARHPLPGAHDAIAVAQAAARVVVLLAPTDTIGAPLLSVIGRGGVRTVALPELSAGTVPPDLSLEQPQTRFARPGLAVDGVAGRAFVVPGSGPVAEVVLSSLAVAYHVLSLARGVESAADGGGTNVLGEGWSRRATWLGRNRLAVTGDDEWIETGPDGMTQGWATAGLLLIDTSTWSGRSVDERADWAWWTGRRLVAVSPGRYSVYGSDGDLRFRRSLSAGGLQVAGPYAFVTIGNEYRRHRVRMVDLESGDAVRTVAVPGWFYPFNRASPELCWC